MKQPKNKQNRISLNRIFHIVNHGWYVESREGSLGPYLNYQEARRSLQHHLRASGRY